MDHGLARVAVQTTDINTGLGCSKDHGHYHGAQATDKTGPLAAAWPQLQVATQTVDLNVAFSGNMDLIHMATSLSWTMDTNMALGSNMAHGHHMAWW